MKGTFEPIRFYAITMVFASICMVAQSGTVLATTLYVHPDGSEKQTGSPDHPFGSLHLAMEAVAKIRQQEHGRTKANTVRSNVLVRLGDTDPIRYSIGFDPETVKKRANTVYNQVDFVRANYLSLINRAGLRSP